MTDKKYMSLALALAKKGMYTCSPNPAVGCVIVKDSKIIGQGYHKKAGTNHAEINALTDANFNVAGATAYVTLEPCSHYGRTPPCAKALVENKVSRVVIAMLDPNPKVAGRGVAILEQAGIKVDIGVCSKKAYKLNRGFFKSITQKRPYVIAKVGMSLDAKTALHTGQSKWITGPKSRSYVQKLRAKADAIITGSQTVVADNPSLNVRFEELSKKVEASIDKDLYTQPLKVILDTNNILNYADFKIFKAGQNIHVVALSHLKSTTEENAKKSKENIKFALQDTDNKDIASNVKEVQLDVGTVYVEDIDEHVKKVYVETDVSGHVNLDHVLSYLDSLEVRNVLVEAGARVTTAFLEQNLVDELCVFTAAKILGALARSAFLSKEVSDLNNLLSYKITKVRKFDDDIFVRYVIEK